MEKVVKNTFVGMEYDAEADVLVWEISKTAPIDHATEMGNVVVHFTKNHRPVLIEILQATQLFKKSHQALESVRLAVAKP